MIFEDIAHRDEVHILGAGHQVDDSLRAAASAADESGFEFFLAGAAHQFRPDQSKSGCTNARRGGFSKERPPCDRVLSIFHDV